MGVPVVTGTLSLAKDEGDGPTDVNLLDLASDVVSSDVLNAVNLTYTVADVATGGGGVDVPAGLSLSGNTLSVDPAHATFDNLAAGGEVRTIVASYNVSDGLDTVGQTLTITITGTN